MKKRGLHNSNLASNIYGNSFGKAGPIRPTHYKIQREFHVNIVIQLRVSFQAQDLLKDDRLLPAQQKLVSRRINSRNLFFEI